MQVQLAMAATARSQVHPTSSCIVDLEGREHFFSKCGLEVFSDMFTIAYGHK